MKQNQRSGREITVADLPAWEASTTLKGGGILEPIHPMLWCPECGEEFSANPSDYWSLPKDHVLKCIDCDGVPLVLAHKRTIYEELELADAADLYNELNTECD